MPVRNMLFALLLGLILPAPGVRAAEPAGKVVRLQGGAEARQDDASRVLAAGDPVRAGETLRTGPGSRLLVLFADGMELTLSDGAEMTVAAFDWDARQAAGKAELTLGRGSFLLRTGAVGKLPDHPLTVRTPLASVGVRGTQFWGGPLDAPLSVLLIEGRVVVSSPTGSVELGTPGEGTSVTEPGATPLPPTFWGEQRIQRAFATVGFEN
ncbi:FecR family protein [Magnetospirillum sp. 15-1]|uniref:FecR family protein n=1 Tax=Magnetospirillum sp. 15-1 TaxID=1979370 RepID=UPI001483990F|nr:FecR family protein [Magnetospirillum sp. 15-1]